MTTTSTTAAAAPGKPCEACAKLATALRQARAALAQCNHIPGVTEQAIWAADAALAGVQ